MTPLMIRISLGFEDGRLLEHIATIERFRMFGGIGPLEVETLALLYARLDVVTMPVPPTCRHLAGVQCERNEG